MPSAFIDSNVLIYAADESLPVPRKTTIAREVLRQRNLWISVQVLSEFTVNARKPDKLGLSPEREGEWLDRLLLFAVSPLSLGTFKTAIAVHTRFGISHWDSLIVAAALETGCEIIYSEDLNDGQDFGGARIVNPFL